MAERDGVPSALDAAMLLAYLWAARKFGRRVNVDVDGGATYATLSGPDEDFEGVGPLATDGSGEAAAICAALSKAPP